MIQAKSKPRNGIHPCGSKRSIVMDEFKNEPNPFNESSGGNAPDPYNLQAGQQSAAPQYDPYNTQPQQGAGQYNIPNQQPQQNAAPQYDPYNTQPQQSAGQYQQPQQNGYNPYNQQQPGGGQYQQGGYTYGQGVPAQGYAPYQRPQSTGMAVASLVLGIISLCSGLFMFAFPVLFLMPIIGLILGIVYKCKKFSVGKGLSTAGIITSAIGLAIPVVLLVIIVVLLLSNGAEIMNYVRQVSPEEYEELYELYGDQFPEWFGGIMSFFIK